MAYDSPTTHGFYLFREALIQIGMVTRDLPRIGSADENCPVNEVDDDIGTNYCIGEIPATKLALCGRPARFCHLFNLKNYLLHVPKRTFLRSEGGY